MADEKQVKCVDMLFELINVCERAVNDLDHTDQCKKTRMFSCACDCGFDHFKRCFEKVRYQYNSQ